MTQRPDRPQRAAALPAEEAQVTLTVLEGPRKGEVFTFSGHEMFIVGRSPRAHLCIADDYLSRHHFLLEIVPPLCRFMDLGSRNRTQINGEVLEKNQSRLVHDGDVIRAGHTTLRLNISAAAGAAPAIDGKQTLELPPTPVQAGGATGSWATSAQAAPAGPASSYSTVATQRDAPPRPTDLCPIIPGYQIERELGHGGMGVVYLAIRQEDGTRVALKTIIPMVSVSQAQVQRFIREANIKGMD